MTTPQKASLSKLNAKKIWLPILIGMAIVFLLIANDPRLSAEKLGLIFEARRGPVALAFLMLLIRDVSYVYRIRTISSKELSWKSSIYVILLWEFSSAVTPSVVGGTAIAIFIIFKEGINPGKSMAYAMITAVLDNCFFVFAVPIAYAFMGSDIIPSISSEILGSQVSLMTIFGISYTLIIFYTMLMVIAILLKPRVLKRFLITITKPKFLRRWRKGAYARGEEIIETSAQLKGKSAGYWIRIVLATIVIWSSRYAVLNFIVASYVDISMMDHLQVFGNHLSLWITMLLSPTPGSSGTAEYFFTEFFWTFLQDFTLATALFWRFITYYPYLILGALILPSWLRRVFKSKKEE
ncbi:MAG: lysylphosphatidylglycerol synthase transmembrane domain-containing protein [Bacteroidota bacterium]